MSKMLRRIVRLLDQGLAFMLIVLVLFSLVVSSLVVITLSPIIAFVGANEHKLTSTTSASWWKSYEMAFINTYTEFLPIIVYVKNLVEIVRE